MTIGPVSQCSVCEHFRSPFSEKGYNEKGATCDAFPDGIPPVIISNQFDHRKPFAGDHGIQWKSDGRPFPELSFKKAP
jgi:hypothetical protein